MEIWGKVISRAICSQEAKMRAERMGIEKVPIEWASIHFSIRCLLPDNKIHQIDRVAETAAHAQQLKAPVRKENLILEVSIRLEDVPLDFQGEWDDILPYVIPEHKHIADLPMHEPRAIITNGYCYTRNGRTSNYNRHKQVLTFFTKIDGQYLSIVDRDVNNIEGLLEKHGYLSITPTEAVQELKTPLYLRNTVAA